MIMNRLRNFILTDKINKLFAILLREENFKQYLDSIHKDSKKIKKIYICIGYQKYTAWYDLKYLISPIKIDSSPLVLYKNYIP